MKIRTKLFITAGVSVAIALLMGVVVLFTSQQVEKVSAKNARAHQVSALAAQLANFRGEYLLSGAERARQQWYASYAALTDLLSAGEFGGSIAEDTAAMEPIFSRLVEHRASRAADVGTAEGPDEVEKLLAAQLSGRSQSLASAVTGFAVDNRAALASAQQRATVLTLALLGALLATMAGTSFLIFVSIANPITRLTHAAESIAEGDLSARVEATGKDELAILGTAFNTMTERLTATIGSLNERIAERKRVEEALALSRQFLNSVIEQSPESMWISDSKGTLIRMNQACRELFGATDEEAIGKYNLLKDNLIEEQGFMPLVKNVFEKGEVARFTLDYDLSKVKHVKMEKATRTFLDVVVSPIKDIHGKLTNALVQHKDITERKQAEEELTQRAEELARSNAELEQFAYIASHDLQEPLRMVASYTQLLGKRYKGKLDGDADEFISFAVEGAKRMQRLINDLLKYSRVGTRGQGPEPIYSEQVLAETLAGLQVAITEGAAQVTHDPLPKVLADEAQLGQIFQNLIANALKYRGDAPPRIHISAAQEGDMCVFSVRDNGIGIDPQYHERVFLIFQRLHTREEGSGTGMGLAVCKKIVERHGGRIWLESELGKGATFYFTIPAVAGTQLAA
jgi:PAS domain S-box-containing protein